MRACKPSCSQNCQLCLWWDCPILEKQRHYLCILHNKRVLVKGVKHITKLYYLVLSYCPICKKYFIKKQKGKSGVMKNGGIFKKEVVPP